MERQHRVLSSVEQRAAWDYVRSDAASLQRKHRDKPGWFVRLASLEAAKCRYFAAMWQRYADGVDPAGDTPPAKR